MEEVAFASLRPKDRLRHKRWQYQLICTDQLIASCAVVDLGYTTHAFLVAVDRAQGVPLFEESFLGAPRAPWAKVNDRPNRGLSARFYHPSGFHLAAVRGQEDTALQLTAQALRIPFNRPSLSLSASFAAEKDSALTVIAPTEGGRANFTQKWAGLPLEGQLTLSGRRYSLDGGVGALDYTQGLLPRRTRWRWAAAAGRLPDGTPVGLNLAEGINDSQETLSENALWVGDSLLPVGRAHFVWNDRDLYEPWKVETEDGVVKLRFVPLHVHREERNLWVVKSRFVQPLGNFEGTLQLPDRTVAVQGWGGVTEDQDTLW